MATLVTAAARWISPTCAGICGTAARLCPPAIPAHQGPHRSDGDLQQKKTELAREGFDPGTSSDAIYFDDPNAMPMCGLTMRSFNESRPARSGSSRNSPGSLYPDHEIELATGIALSLLVTAAVATTGPASARVRHPQRIPFTFSGSRFGRKHRPCQRQHRRTGRPTIRLCAGRSYGYRPLPYVSQGGAFVPGHRLASTVGDAVCAQHYRSMIRRAGPI